MVLQPSCSHGRFGRCDPGVPVRSGAERECREINRMRARASGCDRCEGALPGSGPRGRRVTRIVSGGHGTIPAPMDSAQKFQLGIEALKGTFTIVAVVIGGKFLERVKSQENISTELRKKQYGRVAEVLEALGLFQAETMRLRPGDDTKHVIEEHQNAMALIMSSTFLLGNGFAMAAMMLLEHHQEWVEGREAGKFTDPKTVSAYWKRSDELKRILSSFVPPLTPHGSSSMFWRTRMRWKLRRLRRAPVARGGRERGVCDEDPQPPEITMAE